jgi:hypothetical protein
MKACTGNVGNLLLELPLGQYLFWALPDKGPTLHKSLNVHRVAQCKRLKKTQRYKVAHFTVLK